MLSLRSICARIVPYSASLRKKCYWTSAHQCDKCSKLLCCGCADVDDCKSQFVAGEDRMICAQQCNECPNIGCVYPQRHICIICYEIDHWVMMRNFDGFSQSTRVLYDAKDLRVQPLGTYWVISCEASTNYEKNKLYVFATFTGCPYQFHDFTLEYVIHRDTFGLDIKPHEAAYIDISGSLCHIWRPNLINLVMQHRHGYPLLRKHNDNLVIEYVI